jgi:hypothetical protein
LEVGLSQLLKEKNKTNQIMKEIFTFEKKTFHFMEFGINFG